MPEQLHPRRPKSPPPAARRRGPRTDRAEEESRAFWRLRTGLVSGPSPGNCMSLGRFRLSLVILLSTLLWLAVFQFLHEGFVFLDNSLQSAENFDFMVHMIFVTVLRPPAGDAVVFGGHHPLQFVVSIARGDAAVDAARAARAGSSCTSSRKPMVFTGWGFLLLGSPLLLAYGVAARRPGTITRCCRPLMLAFTYIPVAGGGIVCLLLVRYAAGGAEFMSVAAGRRCWGWGSGASGGCCRARTACFSRPPGSTTCSAAWGSSIGSN